MLEPLGPTKIPFYTGNLSVHPIMVYWGTATGEAHDYVDEERIELIKRVSCIGDVDYQAWCLAEKQPGQWDFSLYIRNADKLHEAGLKYICFCWVHFPPKWYLDSPEYVPYKNIVTGHTIKQISPWSPAIWDVYERFYRAQAEAMGDKIDWIRIATPADYGEIGYPAGLTSWLVPEKHAGPGYWCGDKYALADFQNEMQRRFVLIETLNQRWGTAFENWNAVTFPELKDEQAARTARQTGNPTDRHRWLDFLDWHMEFWERFVPRLTNLIRAFHKDKPLIVSVGYASERVHCGNDYSSLPRMAAEAGVAMQTPGNVPYYAQKRISSACRHWGVPYYTEPPADVEPPLEIRRFFHDISNSVQVFFDYPQNLDNAREQLRPFIKHMTGAQTVVDVAIFHPGVVQHLQGSQNNFPVHSYNLAEQGRDLFDYDLVDENLIAAGALDRYRVLVYVQGQVTEEDTLERILAWIRQGGTLVTARLDQVVTIENDDSLWKEIMNSGRKIVAPETGGRSWFDSQNCQAFRLGTGAVIKTNYNPEKYTPEQYRPLAAVVERAAYYLTDLGPGFRNAPLVDGARDKIDTTLLPDRILYYNGTDQPAAKEVNLRPEDWNNRLMQPEGFHHRLQLPPHSIISIPLVESTNGDSTSAATQNCCR